MARPVTSSKIVIRALGTMGVNVNKNPLELDDAELTRAQNAINSQEGGNSTIRKRSGLIAFTTGAAAGTVLGGVDLPLRNQVTGTRFFYIGRDA